MPLPHPSAARLSTSLVALALCACGKGQVPARVPPPPGEQWTLVAPGEVGMDARSLSGAVSDLPGPEVHGLDGMLVLRHGKPVLEHYWNGYDQDTPHDLRSATKSITSLLVGIALDQHLLSGVQEPIRTYLGSVYPDAPALRLGITLEDLLTMRSGLACNDWDPGSPGNEENMYGQCDWVQFFLGLPAARPPGTLTAYCTAGPVTLGRILGEATRRKVPDFAAANLFGPLGITFAQWADWGDHQQTDTGGHIHLRPRDMSKLGQLALQAGEWNGAQLVSSAWIAQSTRLHTNFDNSDPRAGYGYLWWHSVERYGVGKTAEMFYANGNGGQYIFVLPSLDLVVVFTGENYDSPKQKLPFDLLDRYVLPAVME